jgi:aspartate-semialdehyde dehydrogenase
MIRVGILGATGMVGQRFLERLERHPDFVASAVAASDRSEGKLYPEACAWRLPGEVPETVRGLVVQPCEPPLDCDVVFSSLPSNIAGDVEQRFAAAGYPVLSNSSSHRMDADVPLVIPEVNPDHLALIDRQKSKARSGGFIVTNPNCSAVMVALSVAPLAQRFGLTAVVVTTMQALSGAGYPGVAALDATDNVIPFIAEEEEKIERETKKLLGSYANGTVTPAAVAVSAQCHRVNVTDGHLGAIRVKLARRASLAELRDALGSFRGVPQQLGLPSAPAHPVIVRDEPDRPQPRLDRDAGAGMSVTVGRLAPDAVLDWRFVALAHNTIRGAAGAAILNAELLLARGRLPVGPRTVERVPARR